LEIRAIETERANPLVVFSISPAGLERILSVARKFFRLLSRIAQYPTGFYLA
jgi:hypothetical protein